MRSSISRGRHANRPLRWSCAPKSGTRTQRNEEGLADARRLGDLSRDLADRDLELSAECMAARAFCRTAHQAEALAIVERVAPRS